MPVDDVRTIVVALLYGGLVGVGLARRTKPAPGFWAAGVAAIAGASTWMWVALTGRQGGDAGMAAVSLTFGGGAALAAWTFLRLVGLRRRT